MQDRFLVSASGSTFLQSSSQVGTAEYIQRQVGVLSHLSHPPAQTVMRSVVSRGDTQHINLDIAVGCESLPSGN